MVGNPHEALPDPDQGRPGRPPNLAWADQQGSATALLLRAALQGSIRSSQDDRAADVNSPPKPGAPPYWMVGALRGRPVSVEVFTYDYRRRHRQTPSLH
jgi:hypothetical protein